MKISKAVYESKTIISKQWAMSLTAVWRVAHELNRLALGIVANVNNCEMY